MDYNWNACELMSQSDMITQVLIPLGYCYLTVLLESVSIHSVGGWPHAWAKSTPLKLEQILC